MVIDNRLNTGKIRMAYIVLLSISAFSIAYAMFEGYSFREHYLALAFAGLLILVYMFMHLKNLYYFYYNDEKSHIVIRYYYAHPFMRRYKTFQIKATELDKYEITTTLFGLQKYITLYAQTGKGTAKYPAVSISALSEKELMDLEKALNQNIQFNFKKKR